MAGCCACFGSRKGKKLIKGGEATGVSRSSQPHGASDLPPRENLKKTEKETEPELDPLILKDGPLAHSNAHTFTFQQLKDATKNFMPDTLIGEGGFGSVYRGCIGGSGQVVAIKKLNPTGLQGDKEFLVEVLMLSLLCHPNLVSMIGYCAEGEQRLLVYEYMPLGSLEDHLHDISPDQKPLSWNTRMMIAAGAAKGLDYLHNEANPSVIYRDFKASNILLDEEFQPKLSDFGLAKFGPTGGESHVSTRVMGTHGYCAPEYALTGKLTVKSDIYSFGVVLLELITGCRALDPRRGHGKQNLVEWIRPMLRDPNRCSRLLADPRLKGEFSEPILCKAIEVASMCVREVANARPSMSDVVLALNYLLSKNYDTNAMPVCFAQDNDFNDQRKDDAAGSDEVEADLKADMFDKGCTRMLNKDLDRERAVAEAKMWGESWREKIRQNT